jgi:hypothetical protein
VKSGFDAVRTVLGLVKDVQVTLPPGEKKEAIGKSLAHAEREVQLAEAQVARALGYRLCQCSFPPITMLLAGFRLDAFDNHQNLHECPACKTNTARLEAWERTVGPQAGSKMPRLKAEAPFKAKTTSRWI